MSDPKRQRYLPALRFTWLTPLYDPVLKWLMREDVFKTRMVAQLALRPGMSLLDLGCGTGTLAIMIKAAHPAVEVTGLDGDPAVLAIAGKKALMAGVTLSLDRGVASNLPYPAGSFDRVVSTLVLHHLSLPDKRLALAEARRVLKPGGELHILDFDRPRNWYSKVLAPIMRRFEETTELLDGQLPDMLVAAGFASSEAVERFLTAFGEVASWKARNGPSASPGKG
jgi:ubiquinone/menaquinone biosynthesis C-methylase UbiE